MGGIYVQVSFPPFAIVRIKPVEAQFLFGHFINVKLELIENLEDTVTFLGSSAKDFCLTISRGWAEISL